MAKQEHPYKNAFQCDKWIKDKPCLCPAQLELIHQKTPGSSEIVRGCFYQLFPFLISGVINRSNEVVTDVGDLRRDIQESSAATMRSAEMISMAVRAATIHPEMKAINGEATSIQNGPGVNEALCEPEDKQ